MKELWWKCIHRLAIFTADHLPKLVVYWATVRAGHHAITGQWEGTDPKKVTMNEVMRRWGE